MEPDTWIGEESCSAGGAAEPGLGLVACRQVPPHLTSNLVRAIDLCAFAHRVLLSPDPMVGSCKQVMNLPVLRIQLFSGFEFLNSYFWQLLLAHFGGLTWPTFGRCGFGEAF